MLFPGRRVMLKKMKALKDKREDGTYCLDVPKADRFIV